MAATRGALEHRNPDLPAPLRLCGQPVRQAAAGYALFQIASASLAVLSFSIREISESTFFAS